MKNIAKVHVNSRTLIDTPVACEMLLHLEPPVQLMGWIMYETAARFPEIQSLRVSDYVRGTLTFPDSPGSTGRSFVISPGLMEELQEYTSSLKTDFEVNIRWKGNGSLRSGSWSANFADQLLFPLRAADGYEHMSPDDPISSDLFVSQLQFSANRCGYHGRIHSHSLRLACTRRWMDQKLPVSRIHELLGHRDMMTTLLLVQALQYGGLTFVSSDLPELQNERAVMNDVRPMMCALP